MADEASYNKFLRFFTSRLVQTLVQARLGCKIEQLCSGQPEQPDWFNTRVDELGEIAAYLRTTINEYPPICKSLSIEFLLYTTDGVYLPLESWVMSMDNESQCTVPTEFYHQLGTLLRSASAAARVTPMYRYFVKKQSQDTFVILYRIFKGSMTAELGQGPKEISIGVLPSPVGTVRLDLIYRTDLTIPQLASAETIRKEEVERPPHVNKRRSRYTDDLPCRPSFSDCIPVSGGQVEQAPYSPPCPSLKAESPAQSPSPERTPRFRIGRSTSSEESTQSLHLSSPQETKSCIFASPKSVITHSESFPFASLLLSASPASPRRNTTFCENVIIGNMPSPTTVVVQEPTPPSEETEETISTSPKYIPAFYDDDSGEEEQEEPLIFGQLQTESAHSTLSEFIRECRTAPPNLDGFSTESPESLQSQLNTFLSKEQEFTEFIKTVRDSIDEE